MDDGPFDADLWMLIAAALGVVMAFERLDYEPIHYRFFRWAMLIQLALVAATEAESWRGFLYLLFMPIGAYKVARIVAEPVAARWHGQRRT